MNTTIYVLSKTCHPALWFGWKKANTVILLIDIRKKITGVEDIISRVQGGSSVWGSVLTHNSSAITYQSWGRSLKYNPVVIDFEVSLFAVEETLRP